MTWATDRQEERRGYNKEEEDEGRKKEKSSIGLRVLEEMRIQEMRGTKQAEKMSGGS